MARYFFDIHDGALHRDDVGVDCAGFDAMRREAKRALPEIAREILPGEGDQHAITVRVRDERQETVYTATLTFNGFGGARDRG